MLDDLILPDPKTGRKWGARLRESWDVSYPLLSLANACIWTVSGAEGLVDSSQSEARMGTLQYLRSARSNQTDPLEGINHRTDRRKVLPDASPFVKRPHTVSHHLSWEPGMPCVWSFRPAGLAAGGHPWRLWFLASGSSANQLTGNADMARRN